MNIDEAIRILEIKHSGGDVDPRDFESAFHYALACMFGISCIKDHIDDNRKDANAKLYEFN